MAKPRSDAKLLNLPPEAQDRIYVWLTEGVGDEADTSYKAVREQIYLDFGLRVSQGAMTEFWRKVVEPRKLQNSASAAQSFNEMAAKHGVHFAPAAMAVCQQKAFEVMASPNPDPDQVIALFGSFLQAEKLALKKEDLALQRDKFKAAISKKIDLGLEQLHAEIMANPEALALFERMRAIIKKEVEAA